jgi:hypothetical protein
MPKLARLVWLVVSFPYAAFLNSVLWRITPAALRQAVPMV